MIKNLLVFTLLASLAMPSSFCQDSGGVADPKFVGTWEAVGHGARVVVMIKPDGTFRSEGYPIGKETPDIMTGTWEVNDNKIIWTYPQDTILGPAGTKDVNPIQEATNDKFVIQEMIGDTLTTYNRVVETNQ